jgi:hypothetical protein
VIRMMRSNHAAQCTGADGRGWKLHASWLTLRSFESSEVSGSHWATFVTLPSEAEQREDQHCNIRQIQCRNGVVRVDHTG